LRCGARLLGPPALDTAFNTADLPMMLHLSDLAPRYRKHFLGN
jgi:putative hemolysin